MLRPAAKRCRPLHLILPIEMSPSILMKKLLPTKMARVISCAGPDLFRFGFLVKNETEANHNIDKKNSWSALKKEKYLICCKPEWGSITTFNILKITGAFSLDPSTTTFLTSTSPYS